MSRSFFPVLLFALLFSACDGAELMDPDSETTFRQFELGDMWVMERTFSWEFGHTSSGIDTLEVTDAREIDGEVWFHISSTGDSILGGCLSGSPWYTVRRDGMWVRGISDDEIMVPHMYLPYPSEVGEEVIRQNATGVTRVAEYNEVEINGETIQAIPFEVASKPGFRPFRNSPESLEAVREYPLDRPFQFVDMISLTHGFVHLETVYVTPDHDTERARIVGEMQLDLIKFVPGG